MRYATISVEFPENTLEVIGEYIEHDTSVEFRALLSYTGETVVYRSWTRQILGYFDPDEMLPTPDLKLVKIADTFKKMGEYTFKIRFKTLLMGQE